MKSLIWTVLAVLGLFWTALAWLLHGLAGAGGSVVVTVTRWLELDPSSTQWLADMLSMAGGLAQWIVLAIWLMGAGALLFLGFVGNRAIASAQEAARQMQQQGRGYGAGPIFEGEVSERSVENPDTGATPGVRPESSGLRLD